MNKKFIRKDTFCRICKSDNIETVLKLNNTPLEDQFVNKLNKHIEQKTFPLELAICKKCGYVHLPYIISPEISYVDYLYKSSVTPGLRSHYDEYAKNIVEKYNVNKESLVVDLGSNDGSMLASFKRQGMSVIGVEPAASISDYANQSGIKTINDYFSDKVVSEILADCGKADVVTANYMFANIDGIIEFTKLVESLLSDNGIFVVQTGYHPEQYKLKMFDYIYHEHFSYFTVGVLNYLFKKFSLEIIAVQKTKQKGGSIRVVVQKYNGLHKVESSVGKIIKEETEGDFYNIEMYRKFSNSLQELKAELIKLLQSIKDKKHSIVAFGASHSTTTLLYHFELSDYFEYIVDDNSEKYNLYSPGKHIPVFSTKKIYMDKPDYVLILAWQHSRVIMERHGIFIDNGGKFIVPLPDIKVIG